MFEQTVLNWNRGEQGRSSDRLAAALLVLTAKNYHGVDGKIETSWSHKNNIFSIWVTCYDDACNSAAVNDLLRTHKAREI